MTVFIKEYGLFLSIFFVIIGWAVIFNGSKYIATRSEARTLFLLYLEKLNDTTDSYIDFLSNEESITAKKLVRSTIKKNQISFERIKEYESVLSSYGIDNLANEVDLDDLKFLLTYYLEENKIDEFIENLHRTRSNLEATSHLAFAKAHNPTVSPYAKFLSPAIKAFIFSVVIILTYSYMVNSIYN